MTADDLIKLVHRYTEACDDLGDGLFEMSNAPVIVATDAEADAMNKLHGERYGVDWVYLATAECPDPAGCVREGCNQNRDGSLCDRVVVQANVADNRHGTVLRDGSA